MRYTLLPINPDNYRWTYSAGLYFAAGTDESRYAAIRHLLKARAESREFNTKLSEWLKTIPKREIV